MNAFVFIKAGILIYLFLWALDILTQHYLAGRVDIDRRRLVKLQKFCAKIKAFRRAQKKSRVYFEKMYPREHRVEPLNPALRGGDSKSGDYEIWKTRYYMGDDDTQPTSPFSN